MEKTENVIGKNIRTYRTQKGMTQKEMASYLGVSDRTVGMWERGLRVPRRQNLEKMAELFGLEGTYELTMPEGARNSAEADRRRIGIEKIDSLVEMMLKYMDCPPTLCVDCLARGLGMQSVANMLSEVETRTEKDRNQLEEGRAVLLSIIPGAKDNQTMEFLRDIAREILEETEPDP